MNELLTNPMVKTYGIPVVGAVIVFVVFFLLGRLTKKRGNPQQQVDTTTQIQPKAPVVPKHGPIDVRLYDSTNRTITMTELPGQVADEILALWKSFGRKWLFEGKWVFAINKYIAGDEIKYRPVEAMMSATREHPPSEVHSALVHPEVALFFDVSDKKGMLQQLMPVLIFAGAGIFVLFMWSQS